MTTTMSVTPLRRVLAAVAVVLLVGATMPGSSDPGSYRDGDPLHRLADRISLDPDPGGDVIWHHVRRWSVTTTGWPAPRPGTAVTVVVDLQRWAAPDGSGRIISRAAARPTHHGVDANLTATATRVEELPAGVLSGGCTVPWPCPGMSEPPLPDLDATYPARMVDEFVLLHLHFDLDAAGRAAALRVLAAVPGLTYQIGAGVVDRLGRPGVGVILDVPPIRHRLVLHPDSGRLLAAEHQLTGPHPYLTDVGPPATVEYTLIVDQGRRRLVGHQATPHQPSGTAR